MSEHLPDWAAHIWNVAYDLKRPDGDYGKDIDDWRCIVSQIIAEHKGWV